MINYYKFLFQSLFNIKIFIELLDIYKKKYNKLIQNQNPIINFIIIITKMENTKILIYSITMVLCIIYFFPTHF